MPDATLLKDPARRDVIAGLAALLGTAGEHAFADASLKTVVDQTGRSTTIPKQPQRVISLSDMTLTAPLYELGVPVIGSTRTRDDLHAFQELFGLTGKEAGIEDLGLNTGYDIERIAALGPDLIVTDTFNGAFGAFEQIAPVYVANYFGARQNVRALNPQIAAALGVQSRFEELNAAYRARLNRVAEKLEVNPNGATWIAAMVSDGDIVIGRAGGAFSIVAEDLGFRLPDWVEQLNSEMAFFPISLEELPRINTDLVFFMPTYFAAEQSQQSVKATLEGVMPGWERFVPAVREGHVIYISGSVSIVPAFAAAHQVLDAIEAQWG